MDERRDFINGLVVGAAVGTAIGLLFAPQDGAELRRRIRDQSCRTTDTLARRARRTVERSGVPGAVGTLASAMGDVKDAVQLGVNAADVKTGIELGIESASERLRRAYEEHEGA